MNVPRIAIEMSDPGPTSLRATEARVKKNVSEGGGERENAVPWL